ncbi:hypothetical protein PanWU01x14_060240, partial [Parasponia andersonii]
MESLSTNPVKNIPVQMTPELGNSVLLTRTGSKSNTCRLSELYQVLIHRSIILNQRLEPVHNFILLILIGILGLENPFKVFPSQAHYILHPFHCLPLTNNTPHQTGNSKHFPKLNRRTKGSKVPLYLMQPSNFHESFWSSIKLPWLETHRPLEMIRLIQ